VISVEPSTTTSRVNWQLPVGIACILLGVLVAVQFKVQQRRVKEPTEMGDLRVQLKLTESERNKMSAELQEARNRLVDLEKALSDGQNVTRTTREEIERARLEAGLLPLKGPGVVVKLTDSTRRPSPDDDPYFYIVHDVDLQALVNELWASGAEAVAVNEQRLVTRTSIRCVGPTILVNAVRLAPPYEVKAIGNAQDIYTALNMPGGFLQSMDMQRAMGVEVKISKLDELEVPAFNGSLVYRYAEPAPKPAPESSPEP
jgi:uncharacterized protein YlxW (UPF0749 family)